MLVLLSVCDYLNFTLRYRGKEPLAIGFIKNSAIQDYDNTGIGFAVYQSSKTLLELDNG